MMGKRFDALQPDQIALSPSRRSSSSRPLRPRGGSTLSPKGMDALRVLTPNRILWLNLTGSGNETARIWLPIRGSR